MAWQDQRNWEEAAKAWQRLLDLESNGSRAIVGLARCALKLERWDEAWRWSEALAAQPGRKVDAMMLQADVFLGRGDRDSSRRLMLKGLDDHPRSPQLRIKYGDFAMRAGAPNAAILKGYQPALQLLGDRKDSPTYRHLVAKYNRAVEAARRDAEADE